jgi:isochorismate hydrolase
MFGSIYIFISQIEEFEDIKAGYKLKVLFVHSLWKYLKNVLFKSSILIQIHISRIAKLSRNTIGQRQSRKIQQQPFNGSQANRKYLKFTWGMMLDLE